MDRDILDEIMELMPRRIGKNNGESVRAFVMHNLERSGSLSPTELRDALGVTGPRVTAILHELEAQGLIRRETAPEDRRSVAIFLTEQGKAEVLRHRERRRRRIEQLSERIGPEDTRALARILRALRDMDSTPHQGHPGRRSAGE